MAFNNDSMTLLSGSPFSTHSVRKIPVSQPGLFADIDSIYPLTRSQEGIWIEYSMDSSSTQYNLTLEWTFNGDSSKEVTSVESILKAIQSMTEKHSALRSSVAVIHKKPHIQEHSPLSAIPSIHFLDVQDAKLSRSAVTAALRRPFDLLAEYAVRWYIVQQPGGIQLYLVAHHLVLDGGSMSIISGDLLKLCKGIDAEQSHASERFSQAHLSEQAWIRSQEYRSSLAACLSQIQGSALTIWNVPKTSMSDSADFRRIETWQRFSKEDLSSWVDTYHTSWFRVAVTLVGLLVHGSTQPHYAEDQTIGVAFGGRPKGFKTTIGHFANALPVKIPIWDCLLSEKGSGTLNSLVTAVSRNISKVKKAERISPPDIASASRMNSLQYHHPKVAVSYSPKLAEDSCRLFPVEGSWDLFFVFLEDKSSIELGVIYDPLIFTKESLDGMQSSFQTLLGLSKAASPPFLTSLPGIPKYLSLPQLDSPEISAPKEIAVHRMFELQANSAPDRIAFSCAETQQEMTYGELNTASGIRASFLCSNGVGRESTVLIHLNRGFHVLEWVLATLKAGGAFVYLDPTLPDAWKESIRAASNPVIIITEDSSNSEKWQKEGQTKIVTHTPAHEIEQSSYVQLPSTDGSDLAYIIYTSGSTGEPKGVMIEHQQLASFVSASVPTYEVGYGSRILQFAAFSFDASILEWSVALASGACLCFAASPRALIGEYLADVIDQNRVSFMQITPTALETIPMERDLTSIRRISLGGEAVPAGIIAKWQKRVDVINSYGPTETAIAVSYKQYPKGGNFPEVVSVGKSPKGTQIHVCDTEFTRTLAQGQIGEVCVCGDQIGRGYQALPDITATKFAIHPELNQRAYRTGDRGMIDRDGDLMILGRIDRELKIRGHRIAPEEIEKAILDTSAGISTASVQASIDHQALIAIVAPESCRTDIILDELKGKLPQYMIPSTIHKLASLPLNVHGKTDHKALALTVQQYCEAATRQPTCTRRNETTRAPSMRRGSELRLLKSSMRVEADILCSVASIWQEILRLDEMPKVNVNFFDIGGHSLLVSQLYNRFRQKYPSNPVKLVDLFHQSTVSQQAKLLFPDRLEVSRPEDASATRGQEPLAPTKHRICSTENDQSQISSPTVDSRVGVAIVGVAGRFPGAANVEELYTCLLEGRSGIRSNENTSKPHVPEGCLWVPRAGTLSDAEDFDPTFWNLTKEEAIDMDPQQRLFLDVALNALDDAGIETFHRERNKIGIFVGAAPNTYHTFTEPVYGDPFQQANRGFVAPCISARTAYHLNLHGPNVTLNTNCASSTVALSMAVDALRNNRCDAVIVGGISVQLFNGGYVTQPGQIFSARGECRPFDINADGTVPSDAVVAVVLKRVPDVLDEGASAYAVISGTAVGSDGATQKAGYQVPSPRGQAEVIKEAWNNSGISMDKLAYVELHGSGTPIGDALELEGLKTACSELGNLRLDPPVIGSNKGNLGNTQQASGLVSLVKICKSMQHGVVPATGALVTPNSIIDQKLPFRFALQPTVLDKGDLVAISAAGWGGVNSHIVLQYPPDGALRPTDARPTRRQLQRITLKGPRRGEANPLDSSDKETLAAIVFCASNILGGDIRSDTDLRAAGMDSKAFVLLVGSIRERLGGSPVPVSGFMAPVCTPSTLTSLYISHNGHRNTSVASGIITVLQDGQNDGKIFLLIPPAGYSYASLSELSSVLPSNSRVLALNHPTHPNPGGNSLSVAELAHHFTNTLRSHLTASPLTLIGASFGGIIATEMAQIIRNDNLVSSDDLMLVLLDSPAPRINEISSSISVTPISDSEEANRSSIGSSPSSSRGSQCSPPSSLTTSRESLPSNIPTSKDDSAVDALQTEDILALRELEAPKQPLEIKSLYVGSEETWTEQTRASWNALLPSCRFEKVPGGHVSIWHGETVEKVVEMMGW